MLAAWWSVKRRHRDLERGLDLAQQQVLGLPTGGRLEVDHKGPQIATLYSLDDLRELMGLPKEQGLKLDSLHTLYLRNDTMAEIEPTDIQGLSDLSGLRELGLAGFTLTSDVVQGLAGCPSLETIYLAEASISTNAWKELRELPHLRNLRILYRRERFVNIDTTSVSSRSLSICRF